MGNLIEPYKYCADVLKYSGFAFLAPAANLIFNFITNNHFKIDLTKLDRYAIAGLFFVLGIECILRGLSILEKGVIHEVTKS
jgi:hypothetical protein